MGINMAKDITLKLDQRSIDLRNGLYNALERAVQDALRHTNLASQLVVDVGAGRGELLQRLASRKVECLGIDPEADCVAMASKHGRCIQGGIDDLQQILGSQVPQVVVCSHVLEHLNAPFDAIRTMHKSGAREIVLAVPNVLRSARLVRAMLGRRRGDHPEHVYSWGHAEFEALVKRAGYVPVEWYVDRVTINPFTSQIGGFLTSKLRSFEEGAFAKFHPTLSSSLILRCSRNDDLSEPR